MSFLSSPALSSVNSQHSFISSVLGPYNCSPYSEFFSPSFFHLGKLLQIFFVAINVLYLSAVRQHFPYTQPLSSSPFEICFQKNRLIWLLTIERVVSHSLFTLVRSTGINYHLTLWNEGFCKLQVSSNSAHMGKEIFLY